MSTPRTTWKGFLKLSLVTIPVQAVPAADTSETVHFHQLHADCHRRIQHRKTCPLHGEVHADAIVAGYEFTKDQYVVLDPAELDHLKTPQAKTLTIDTFLDPEALDPLASSGRSHYLLPDGPVGQKPYAVLHHVMVELHRHALVQGALHSKAQPLLLRPHGKLLVLTALHYAAQVRSPALFQDRLVLPELAPVEVALARTLVAAATAASFDYARYRDESGEQVRQLIEAKVAGQAWVPAAVAEPGPVLNLLEALQQSVARVQPGKSSGVNGKAMRPRQPRVGAAVRPAARRSPRAARGG